MPSIIIPKRFSGPPNSGNGGYTCGLLSEYLGGPAEVTLRKPIPIEREMDVVSTGADSAQLKYGDALIAEAVRFVLELGELPKLGFSDAAQAAEISPAFHQHPFPTCFVCGPERASGDGLRIFPGAVKSVQGGFDHLFAAPWTPDQSLPNIRGIVHDEIVWAALDCPTGFAGGFPYEGTLVTGRLGVSLKSPVRIGEPCVLLSWRLSVEGRKHHAAAVLVGENGRAHAHAKATWIKLG